MDVTAGRNSENAPPSHERNAKLYKNSEYPTLKSFAVSNNFS